MCTPDDIVATDFFKVEVLTAVGVVRHHVAFVLYHSSRRVAFGGRLMTVSEF